MRDSICCGIARRGCAADANAGANADAGADASGCANTGHHAAGDNADDSRFADADAHAHAGNDAGTAR
jgi:hypothetical protein